MKLKLSWHNTGGFCYTADYKEYSITVFHNLEGKPARWYVDTISGGQIAHGEALTSKIAQTIAEVTTFNHEEKKDENVYDENYYNDYDDVDGNLYGLQ